MSSKEVQYITPPNNLRMKQKLAGVTGTIDAVWIDAAEKSMGNARFDYLEAVSDDLNRLQAAYDAAYKDRDNRAERVQELYAIVQMIKGQGSSFGYPLISNVGAQLARFMEDCGDNLTDAQMEGVKLHVETLRLIMQQKMEGDGGPMGQKIVAGLALVIKKMTGGAEPAPA
jgi:hypothetical protein